MATKNQQTSRFSNEDVIDAENEFTAQDDDFFTDSGSEAGGVEDLDDAVFNLEDAEEPVYEVFRPGTYDAKISKVEATYSNQGNAMLKVALKAYSDDGTEATVFDNWTFTQNNLHRLRTRLKLIAPDINLRSFSLTKDTDQLVGRPARLKLKVERYQGVNRNKVADYLPVGEAASFLDS